MKIFKISEQKYSVQIGKKYWFEYHCYEGHDSSDAKMWYHSHQIVTVISLSCEGNGDNKEERGNNGEPAVFRIRFNDGLEYDAFEDELMNSKKEFTRQDPPKQQ
jgi:hypothetical protein